jgi:hypothetical protein
MITRRILILLFLIFVVVFAANAQSQDRSNPTPLNSNMIKGAGAGQKVEYFYSFTAGPGEVALATALRAKSGSTGAEVEVFDADSNKIFYYYPNATSTYEHAVKRFTVKSKQTVLLRLAFDRDLGNYVIRLSGAVELGADDTQATPAEEVAPDLVVTQIIFDDSPSRIRVRVMNAGNGASAKCFLALTSLAGNDESLGTKQRTWSIPIPALAAGKGFSNVIDVSPLTQTTGPWKAMVDRSNTVKESNEDNNTLTFPQAVGPKSDTRW